MGKLNKQINAADILLDNIEQALADRGIDVSQLNPSQYPAAIRSIVGDITIENIGLLPVTVWKYTAETDPRPLAPLGGCWNVSGETQNHTFDAPEGWFIDIKDFEHVLLDRDVVWMSTAVFKSSGGIYANWTTPLKVTGIHGKDGRTGAQGAPGNIAGIVQTFYTPIYFATQSEAEIPATPTSCSYDLAAGELVINSSIWHKEITSNAPGLIWWQSIAKYKSNDTNVYCSKPIKISTSPKDVVEGVINYYLLTDSLTPPSASHPDWLAETPTGFPVPTINKRYLWIKTVTTFSNSTVVSPVYLLTKYQKGLNAIDFDYTCSADRSVIEAPNYAYWFETSEEALNKTTDYPGLTEETKYLWCREAFIFDDSVQYFYRIISTFTAAEKAAIIYSAGIFNDKTFYKRSEEQRPYIYYPDGLKLDSDHNISESGEDYYYFILKYSYDDPLKSVSINSSDYNFEFAYNNGNWEPMKSFEAIYSDVGVLKAALVGQFVFDDKYMFSQKGRDKLGNPTVYTNYTDFTTTTFPEGFDSDVRRHGVALAIELKEFIPEVCINTVTGEAWFGHGNSYFGPEGSGWVAGSKIHWTKQGKLLIGDESSGFMKLENGNLVLSGQLRIGAGTTGLGNISEWTTEKALVNTAIGDLNTKADNYNAQRIEAETALENKIATAKQTLNDKIDLTEFTLGQQITDLDGQTTTTIAALNQRLDGMINHYFQEGLPPTSVVNINTLFEIADGDNWANHIGNTFTNINPIEADENGGKSWRWCKVNSSHTVPASEKIEDPNNPGSFYHWHPITDSGAAGALSRIAEVELAANQALAEAKEGLQTSIDELEEAQSESVSVFNTFREDIVNDDKFSRPELYWLKSELENINQDYVDIQNLSILYGAIKSATTTAYNEYKTLLDNAIAGLGTHEFVDVPVNFLLKQQTWYQKRIIQLDIYTAVANQQVVEAQDTADGKCTTYLVKPTSYREGDIWILESDYESYKKGTILIAISHSGNSFKWTDWSNKVIYTTEAEVDGKINIAKTALEVSIASLESVASTTLADLNRRLDGKISNYFQPNDPPSATIDINTLFDIQNEDTWLQHVGNTFTNINSPESDASGGKSWRWCLVDSDHPTDIDKYQDPKDSTRYFHWHEILDPDATKALEQIAEVEAVNLSRYNSLQEDLNTTNEELSEAKTELQTTITDFENNIANDKKFSKGELTWLKSEKQNIEQDKKDLDNLAARYGALPGTLTTAYNNYLSALNTSINNLTPEGVKYINIPSDFLTKQKAWYEKRVAQLETYSAIAKTQVDTAQITADGKITTHLSKPSSYRPGDLWILNDDYSENVSGTVYSYEAGVILVATELSNVFNITHWSNRVSYAQSQQLGELNTSLTTAINNANNEAKGYTDTAKAEVNAAIAGLDEAKAEIADVYTKTDILGREITLSGQIKTDAQAAAENYTNAKIGFTDKTVKAYADGVKTDAEAYALQQAQEKANAAKAELQSSINTMQGTINTANAAISALEGDITNINARLDGVVTMYTGARVPDLSSTDTSNIPYYNWVHESSFVNTDLLNYIGDTYTFTGTDPNYTGKTWRWVNSNSAPVGTLGTDYLKITKDSKDYYLHWVEVVDSQASAAYTLASQAKALADGKMQVFVARPSKPYQKGDLWILESSTVFSPHKAGEIMVSDINRASIPANPDEFPFEDWTSKISYASSTDVAAIQTELTTLTAEVETIEGRLDGVVMVYTGEGAPTYSTAPTSNWSEAKVLDHLGDIYTNTKVGDATEGKSWKWVKVTSLDNGWTEGTHYITYNGEYFRWQLIEDPDLEQALTDSSHALALADGKMRIFTDTPATPYDVGDLWILQNTVNLGTTANPRVCLKGTILRSSTSLATGTYEPQHWISFATYADKGEFDSLSGLYQNTKITVDDLYAKSLGSIEVHAAEHSPTFNNEPYSTWDTPAKIVEHIGDIFINKIPYKVGETINADAGKIWVLTDLTSDGIAGLTLNTHYKKVEVESGPFTGTYYICWKELSGADHNKISELVRELDDVIDDVSAAQTAAEAAQDAADIANASITTLNEFKTNIANDGMFSRREVPWLKGEKEKAQRDYEGLLESTVEYYNLVRTTETDVQWIALKESRLLTGVKQACSSYIQKINNYIDTLISQEFLSIESLFYTLQNTWYQQYNLQVQAFAAATASNIKNVDTKVDNTQKVFITEEDQLPVPPYRKGDLWLLRSGEILACQYDLSYGNDSELRSAWQPASNYGDKATIYTTLPADASAFKYKKGDLIILSSYQMYEGRGFESNKIYIANNNADPSSPTFIVGDWDEFTDYQLVNLGIDVDNLNTAINSFSHIKEALEENNYTEINQGLILTSHIQVGSRINDIYQNTGGIQGIINPELPEGEINPLLWGGGTFEQAKTLTGGKPTAKFVVDHDGRMWAKDAYIEGQIHATSGTFTGVVNATGGAFHDVEIYGTIRSPFIEGRNPYTELYSDNVYVTEGMGGGPYVTEMTLPWTIDNSGRKICLAGGMVIHAPTGYCFFENGEERSTLKTGGELVELLGFGTRTGFKGWVVLTRKLLYATTSNGSYGREHPILAVGTIVGGPDGASIRKAKTFDNQDLAVSRDGVGNYRLRLPTEWFNSKDHCVCMLTAEGEHCTGASVVSKHKDIGSFYIEIQIAKALSVGGVGDGSVSFVIYNIDYW